MSTLASVEARVTTEWVRESLLPADYDESKLRYPDPVPLGVVDIPAFPDHVLPGWLREYVRSVANSTQTPLCMAAMRGLSVVSTAIMGKGVVEVRFGFTQPLQTYEVNVSPPATRKSAVNTAMTRPVRKWELDREEETRAERAEARNARVILEKKRENLQKELARAQGVENEGELRTELHRIEDRLRELPPSSPPRLLADDVTHEKVVGLLADNQGCIATLEPEGRLFSLLSGAYTKGVPSLELHNKCWTSEPVRVDRQGREGEHIHRPCMTLGVSVQPSVLEALKKIPAMRGEGLMGRVLWTAPPSTIGERLTGDAVPELSEHASNEYDRTVRKLLNLLPAGLDSRGERIPHVMRLSAEARAVYFDCWHDLERMLGMGGALYPIQDWGGKLNGQVLRIAGQLHIAELVNDDPHPFAAPITANAMRGAAEVVQFLIPHALHVFDEIGEDRDANLARYVWGRMTRDMSKRDLFRLVQNKVGIETVDDLDRILGRLKEHKMVFVDVPNEGTTGRPSEFVRRNPKAIKSSDKSDRTTLKAV